MKTRPTVSRRAQSECGPRARSRVWTGQDCERHHRHTGTASSPPITSARDGWPGVSGKRCVPRGMTSWPGLASTGGAGERYWNTALQLWHSASDRAGWFPAAAGGMAGMPWPRARPPRPPGDVGVYQCTHGRAHEAVRAVDASLYETGITGCVLGCVARDLSASARPPSRLRGRHFYTSACSTAPWRLRPLLSAYRTHEGAEKHQWGLSATHSNTSCV